MENDTFWLQAKVFAHPGRGQLGFTLLSVTNQVKDFFYNGELSEELIFQMKKLIILNIHTLNITVLSWKWMV